MDGTGKPSFIAASNRHSRISAITSSALSVSEEFSTRILNGMPFSLISNEIDAAWFETAFSALEYCPFTSFGGVAPGGAVKFSLATCQEAGEGTGLSCADAIAQSKAADMDRKCRI